MYKECNKNALILSCIFTFLTMKEMKQLKSMICELCGSNEFIKDDGFFVCQHCNTKYTTEEAKKLMVEGTVKIDHSDFVERSLQNARRAKEKEDWDETEKYYNLVEQYDPNNIEAIFYSSYGKAKKSLVESDLYKRQAAFKVLTNCVSIIDDNYDIKDDETNKQMVMQISNDIITLASSDYVFNQWKNGYGVVVRTDKLSTVTLFNNVGLEYAESLKNIAEKYPMERKNERLYFYDLALRHLNFILKNGSLANPSIIKGKIMDIHRLMNSIDSTHAVPEQAPEAGKKQSSGAGCYVATAVYGSYDCPQVWTLRRYRDFDLAANIYGRCFIRFYYALSPTLVKWFGTKKWFKSFWRKRLDRMVDKLNKKGYENTYYDDIDWRALKK